MFYKPTEYYPNLGYRPYRSVESKGPISSPKWSVSRLGDRPEEYFNSSRSIVPRYRVQLSSIRDSMYNN
jgi:hypothetical protein